MLGNYKTATMNYINAMDALVLVAKYDNEASDFYMKKICELDRLCNRYLADGYRNGELTIGQFSELDLEALKVAAEDCGKIMDAKGLGREEGGK